MAADVGDNNPCLLNENTLAAFSALWRIDRLPSTDAALYTWLLAVVIPLSSARVNTVLLNTGLH
jgi:hypothetical protein